MMTIQVEARTDKGLIRPINEDSIATIPERGLVVLADGMGGYNAGEVASQLAVEQISSYLLSRELPDVEAMVTAVERANSAILTMMESADEYQGMATTVVMASFGAESACFAHVGDSRIYQYRDGRLEQLTQDHSMIQELINQGMFNTVEEAEQAGVKKNILIRGVGIEEQVQVDIREQLLRAGDRYLLCSDGLSDMVIEAEIAKVLGNDTLTIAEMADTLLKLALEQGGRDNISVIVVSVVNND